MSSSRKVFVTVCEMRCETPEEFTADWEKLKVYLQQHPSAFVLLPEMPFYRWLPNDNKVDQKLWKEACDIHDVWINERLSELPVPAVLGSRPVVRNGVNLNEGFVWTRTGGYAVAHHKYNLPEQPGYFEATWYRKGEKSFNTIAVNSGDISCNVGFQICSELWFTNHAREYGKQGGHIVVTPRATGKHPSTTWTNGGQVCSIVSGCYSLSSNRSTDASPLGGGGWIVSPDGKLIGETSREQPFFTAEIDLDVADQAKKTYPRYIED